MKLSLKKHYFGSTLALIPADDVTLQYCKKLSLVDVILGNFTKPRNYKYHKKYFSMLNTAFDMWDAPNVVEYQGVTYETEKEFEEFRKWLIIQAGYYKIVLRPDGTSDLQPQSISFASMEEDGFAKLYSNTVSAIIKHVIPDNGDEAEYMALFQQILQYD